MFHIWLHVSHRQYVDASIFSFAVVTLDDPQNGQVAGIGRPARSSSASCSLFTFDQLLDPLATREFALALLLESGAVAVSSGHENLLRISWGA